MSDDDKNRCGSCRWWDAESESRINGWCRYGPPTATGSVGIGVWPKTHRTKDWCAQHSVSFAAIDETGD